MWPSVNSSRSRAAASPVVAALLPIIAVVFIVEAVHRAPPQSRGLAMGAYTAFLDLALGLANPALGLVASGAGLRGVYLVSTLVVLCAAPIAVRLLKPPSLEMASRSQDYEK